MSWESDFNKRPAKTLFKAGLLIFLGITALSALGFVTGVVSMPFRSAKAIAEKTLDADNVISNYEWFKQQHEDWNAINDKIESADGSVTTFVDSLPERSEWHREDRIEYSRLSSIADGLRFQRDDIESKYNARSRMMNRKVFKAGDVELPESL